MSIVSIGIKPKNIIPAEQRLTTALSLDDVDTVLELVPSQFSVDHDFSFDTDLYGSDAHSGPKTGTSNLLITACSSGSIDVVKALLKLGANVHCADHSGKTPLMLAAIKNSIELCKVLIEAGARIGDKDHKGRTACDWAPKQDLKDYLDPYTS